MIYFLIAIKAWQVFEGPILDYLDGRFLGHALRMNEKKRIELRNKMAREGHEFLGWKVWRPATIFFGCQYVIMVIVSWVVSRRFSGVLITAVLYLLCSLARMYVVRTLRWQVCCQTCVPISRAEQGVVGCRDLP